MSNDLNLSMRINLLNEKFKQDLDATTAQYKQGIDQLTEASLQHNNQVVAGNRELASKSYPNVNRAIKETEEVTRAATKKSRTELKSLTAAVQKVTRSNQTLGKSSGNIKRVGDESRQASKATGEWRGQLQSLILLLTSGALAVWINQIAQARREMANFAFVANQGVEEFSRFAFAAERSTGLQADAVAAILQDANDKIGDFVETGGGAFADWVENIGSKIGITAEQLQGLTGEEILGEVTQAITNTNKPASSLVFYLEGLASESTKLAPLFADNAKLLKQNSEEFDRLNLAVSEIDDARLVELSGNITTLGTAWETTSAELAADLAPTIGAIIQELSKILRSTDDAIIKLSDLTTVAGAAGTAGAILFLYKALGKLNKAFYALSVNPATAALYAVSAAAGIALTKFTETLALHEQVAAMASADVALYEELNAAQSQLAADGQAGSAAKIAQIRQQFNLEKASATESRRLMKEVLAERQRIEGQMTEAVQEQAKLRTELEKISASEQIKLQEKIRTNLEKEIGESLKLQQNYAKKIKVLRDENTAEEERTADELRAIKRESLSEEEAQIDLREQIDETIKKSQEFLRNGDAEEAKRQANKARGFAGELKDRQAVIGIIQQTSQITIDARNAEIEALTKAQNAEKERHEKLDARLAQNKASVLTLRAQVKLLDTQLANLGSSTGELKINTNISAVSQQLAGLQSQFRSLFGESATINSALIDVGGSVSTKSNSGSTFHINTLNLPGVNNSAELARDLESQSQRAPLNISTSDRFSEGG